MTLLNDAPRPWVALFDGTDEEAASIEPYCGKLVRTSKEVGSRLQLEEFDVVIGFNGEYHSLQGTKYRLIFGRGIVGPSFSSRWTDSWVQYAPTHRLRITSAAKELGLASLVERTCIPPERAEYRGYQAPYDPYMREIPLLVEGVSSPMTLAAMFVSPENNHSLGIALWLPSMARNRLIDWVEAAFQLWGNGDAEAFPSTSDWESKETWSSAEEIEARRTLSEFDAEEERRRDASNEARTSLATALDGAVSSGDDARRLLTQDSDGLVQAVTSLLEDLGFGVIDADALPEHKAAKKEDLRVSSGDRTILVEVKGYTRGARVNDLMQVQKAGTSFYKETGKDADALWYIVNAHRNDPPDGRPQALASDPTVVESFGEDLNGAVIDTRDLFRLWQAFKLGRVTGEEARDHLMSTRGHFRYPSEGNA